MQNGPLLLTGFGALNKLLGKEVYTSQDQLGGPQIMLPNGVAHQLAVDDQDGVEKILRWLSYVPKTAGEQASLAPSADPVDRAVTFTPTKGQNVVMSSTPRLASSATMPGGSGQHFGSSAKSPICSQWNQSITIIASGSPRAQWPRATSSSCVWLR